MRYCNMTNGGPVFVYVKDGKIVRMTPIDLAEDDGASFTIEAQGLKLTPPRKTTLAPHGQNAKSIVYSPDRLLYPMKRVDFDPNGARNPQNRGKSGYVRISWDEAITIVTDEIKRQKSELRPGLHRGVARLAPHLGQHRLLPLGAVSLLQRHRHDARPPQSRFVGGLVLGRGASLGPHAARRPVGDLRHRRGLPAELRHDRVVGGRPGDHLRLLRRAGRHRAPAVAEGPQARHQGRPRRSRTTTPPRSSCPASGSRRSRPRRRRWRWRSPTSGSRKASTTRSTSKTHTVGFDVWKAYLTGEEDGIAEDAGVAGEGNRRPGQGRARARPRVGHEARLSRARRLGQRPRRRLPQPDRHPVGARDGVPVGDAGARQARLQHGQSAMGHAGRLQFLFPRLFRRRHVGRPREHRDAGRALPAHAAAADHELQRPADPAHLAAGGDRRRQGRGLPLGRQVDRAPVRQVRAIRRPAIRR